MQVALLNTVIISSENVIPHKGHAMNADNVQQLDKGVELESRLIDSKQKFKAEIEKRRWFFLGASVFAVILGLEYSDQISLGLGWIAPSWLLFILFSIAGFGTTPDKILTDIEKLISLKKIHFSFLDAKDEPYFDKLVKINVENLSEYYLLVKKHTEKSFTLSVAIILLGFGLIAGGLWMGYLNPALKDISYITTASGTLVSFVGGSVFWLYSRTVEQLKHYHDSLLDVQNILLAFKLIEGTASESERSIMTQKMIESLSIRRNQ